MDSDVGVWLRGPVKKFLNLMIPPQYQSGFKEGRKCAAYDVDYDPKFMDILKPEGYAHALYQVLRLKPGSSLTLAPVCSSWVWMSFGFKKIKLYG